MMPLFRAANADARRQALEIIMARGADSPASLAYLTERTGLSERAVKDVVEQARAQGKCICASRRKPNGYYLASDEKQVRESCRTMRNQARRMLFVIGRMAGGKELKEILGQLTMELRKEFGE